MSVNLPDLACPSRFRALRAKIEAAGGTAAIGGSVVTRTHAARDRTAHPVPVEKDDKQFNRWHERKPEPAYPFKRAGVPGNNFASTRLSPYANAQTVVGSLRNL